MLQLTSPNKRISSQRVGVYSTERQVAWQDNPVKYQQIYALKIMMRLYGKGKSRGNNTLWSLKRKTQGVTTETIKYF
ncbi:hypothetical protein FGO68_gene15524 [Halteria grandinella]|uniref:Uncharacterized protein n=1 Tax=Halteria grandinella TaxID=5974 RepID=A0A8J8NTW0_HALGN|nr:hypothetical protein FGO68_gene15524 [Halteria grandinella]